MVRVSGEVLAQQAAQGDRAAFVLLLHRHEPMLRRIASARLDRAVRRHHGVDDVVQEVWMAVFESVVRRRRFVDAGPGSLKRYLAGICRNKTNDACRRTKRVRMRQVDVDPEYAAGDDPRCRETDPVGQARLREMLALYEDRLEQVQQPSRSYFERVVLHGEPVKDVATTAEVSTRTVQRAVAEVSRIIGSILASRLN